MIEQKQKARLAQKQEWLACYETLVKAIRKTKLRTISLNKQWVEMKLEMVYSGILLDFFMGFHLKNIFLLVKEVPIVTILLREWE